MPRSFRHGLDHMNELEKELLTGILHMQQFPGEVLEIWCQHCGAIGFDFQLRGTSPQLLAQQMYEHFRQTHPAVTREPSPAQLR